MPNTIQIHRVLRAAPEKVYRAFPDPAAMAKWLSKCNSLISVPLNGHVVC